ncbi:MAG: hypothetical protein AMXMBFR34_40980 [Myxococcaceae bacterium]
MGAHLGESPRTPSLLPSFVPVSYIRPKWLMGTSYTRTLARRLEELAAAVGAVVNEDDFLPEVDPAQKLRQRPHLVEDGHHQRHQRRGRDSK